jgi:hypothetical protein
MVAEQRTSAIAYITLISTQHLNPALSPALNSLDAQYIVRRG